MQLPRLPRLLALSTPLTLLLAVAPTACTIDGLDELGNGSEDDDEDEDAEETEGAETEGEDRPSIESGDGEEEGGDEEPGSESGGEDPETSGGEPTPGACAAYCEVELACDAVYASVDECVAACSDEVAAVGACADPFLAMTECLGTLDCEAFATFWASVDELYQTGEVAPFPPCDQAFIDFANCVQGA